MSKITKSSVYKSLIDVHVASGQGLSGIVKVHCHEYSIYLDELIEEGMVVVCGTGGSIGHPESNIFYMPTKGYNVWLDEGVDGECSRFSGRYLQFVRLYLGILTDYDEDREDLQKAINPSNLDLIRS